MTDKQIIIDGVDVSGCPHYIDKDSSCSSQDCECIKCIHNECFYKDYKAKEQECEELKKQHQADKGLITSTGKMNYQLLQEYDKLKAENEQLKNNDVFSVRYFKDKNDELKAENEKLDTENKRLVAELANPVFDSFEELDKLKQTLTEIKEIAKFDCSCGHNQMCVCNVCDKFDEILQKISECEVE